MKVAAFIPARYGSTRLDGKPLADIRGKPMIQWVYERVSRARLVGSVVVATDDERIKSAVEGFGGSVVMTSPDCASGTDRVAEAARSTDADVVVNVQGDEPLIEPSMIDAAVEPFAEDPGLMVSTLRTEITDEAEFRDPNAVKVVTDSRGYALYFSRSPVPFSVEGEGGLPKKTKAWKHIGLYAFRRDFLFRFTSFEPTPLEKTERLEQLRALENGVAIRVVATPHNPASVDTPEDLERVRRVMAGMEGA